MLSPAPIARRAATSSSRQALLSSTAPLHSSALSRRVAAAGAASSAWSASSALQPNLRQLHTAGPSRRQLQAPLVLRLGPSLRAPSVLPSSFSEAQTLQVRRAFATASTSSSSKAQAEPETDPDEPPPKAGFRERLRFLSRRYGWWALAVYLLASLVDFSLTFAAIHWLGADHIRELEARLRAYIGMDKRDTSEEHDTGKGLKEMLGIEEGVEPALENNFPARQAAAAQRAGSSAPGKAAASSSGSSGSLWAEAVLAYTIHKTLLLPFRVAVTAAVLPSFVKLMVRWGLSKPNAAVRAATKAAKQATK